MEGEGEKGEGEKGRLLASSMHVKVRRPLRLLLSFIAISKVGRVKDNRDKR